MLHAVIVFALLLQDTPSEISRQAARISAKDPHASLDAVSRLSELAVTSRASVEKAAAAIPENVAFYRLALQEELRARDRLGELYPKLKRASIDAKDLAAIGVLNEMCTKFGEKLELANYTRPGMPAPAQGSVTVRLEDASFAESLAAVARQTKMGFYWNGVRLMPNPFQETIGAFGYRNFFAFISFATRSRKIEFGAGETRSLRYAVSLYWDSQATVARIVKVRVVEALDGNGKAVPALPDEPTLPEAPRKEGDPVGNVHNRFNQWEIALAIPDSEKIARLRGFYEVAVAGAVSAFEFADLEKDQKKSDDFFEIELTQKVDVDGAHNLVRVKPKGPIDEFLKTPVELLGVFSDGAEYPLHSGGRVTEGRVDYPFFTNRHVGQPQALKSVRLRISRTLVERCIPFEFVDLPAK